jgi:cell wall-associated protease
MTTFKTSIILGLALLASPVIHAQPISAPRKAPQNWPYLDPARDSVAGISLDRAYELLKGRTAQPVIVTVLDAGVDVAHEDLKDVLWTNAKESAAPDNNKDDDRNGYTDDMHGWNFMAAKDGTTYEYDQEEVTQIYAMWRTKYDRADRTKLNPVEQRQFDTYQKAKKGFLERSVAIRQRRAALQDSVKFFAVIEQMKPLLADKPFTAEAIGQATLPAQDSLALAVRSVLVEVFDSRLQSFDKMSMLLKRAFPGVKGYFLKDADKYYNLDSEQRKLVGDDPLNPSEKNYGSSKMIIGESEELAMHGTHVAGIIGAKRGNGKGMDGVADNARVMTVAVVPSGGDERDKDVANGIRYAVDNGAKIINMSFGKRLSPYKEQIDAAFKYAEAHDVLIVHASGNNGENYDSIPAYPTFKYEDGTTAQNFLTVGNSTFRLNENLAAESSNYGSQSVDLFAPGTDIYATLPHNNYASLTGTSMAAPCVAGVAALLRGYFPKLTAVQVKDILLKTVYKPNLMVKKPGADNQKVPFSSLSRSGGIVNAYEAVKLAMTM